MGEPAEASLDFSKLSTTVSLYKPILSTPPAGPRTQRAPTTVLLFQWMGASPKSRFLNTIYRKYRELYPSTDIISVRSLPEFFMTTSTARRLATYEPMVTALRSNHQQETRILVHLFSNGGAAGLVDVCTIYQERTGQILPIEAMVLDSTPGEPTFKSGWAAMNTVLPKGLVWYPAALLTLFFLLLAGLRKRLFGIDSMIDATRKSLNDWDLVKKDATRLYVFSEGDKLVEWQAVEKHALDAKEAGCKVTMLKESDSPHVQHMIRDGERYWKMVQELWDSASS